MFEVWARSRETKKYIKLGEFWDIRNVNFEADQVDSEQYYEVMIMQGRDLIFYKELKKVSLYEKSRRKNI
jgi:hypothetical protein